MATITKEQTKTDSKEKVGDVKTILLWNDPVNSFDHVIECLMKYCDHEYEQANQVANLVHFKGKCDVKRGPKEEMQEIKDKLQSCGLTVTLED